MEKHVNIPVFIPHLGCPNDCVFCNQRIISGKKEFYADEVIPIIEEALSTVSDNCKKEIAFFGGSFTGIDKCLMEKLLIISNQYLKSGRINSIRCSTRPDYISADVLNILKKYNVETVELGLQSVSQDVLNLCKRGHNFDAEINATRLIKEWGFRLGGQMMIGLPGSSLEDEIATAKFIVQADCDEARIYPTIVFKDTELQRMADRGEYNSLDLDEAVSRSAKAFAILIEGGVKVLRIGLCDSENLHSDKTYHSGPNHAAIGELVENEFYYNLICEKLQGLKFDNQSDLILNVPTGHTSKVIGQHRKNKIRLFQRYGFRSIKVCESNNVSEYSVFLKVEERK